MPGLPQLLLEGPINKTLGSCYVAVIDFCRGGSGSFLECSLGTNSVEGRRSSHKQKPLSCCFRKSTLQHPVKVTRIGPGLMLACSFLMCQVKDTTASLARLQ